MGPHCGQRVSSNAVIPTSERVPSSRTSIILATALAVMCDSPGCCCRSSGRNSGGAWNRWSRRLCSNRIRSDGTLEVLSVITKYRGMTTGAYRSTWAIKMGPWDDIVGSGSCRLVWCLQAMTIEWRRTQFWQSWSKDRQSLSKLSAWLTVLKRSILTSWIAVAVTAWERDEFRGQRSPRSSTSDLNLSTLRVKLLEGRMINCSCTEWKDAW